MPYIPHTDADTLSMLACIGVPDIDDLFDEIPAELQHGEFKKIPAGMNEMEMLKHAEDIAANNNNYTCFIGAGSYDHHIPAAVWDIASRGEFMTSYTPYQAEASQGTLQVLYEYQSMIAELTGMDVANASMYDGASALAEAVLMAMRINKSARTVLVAGTLHPLYKETLATILASQHIKIIILEFEHGTTLFSALSSYHDTNIGAIIIPQPNFFGCLEAVDALSDWAHERKIISIACVNPIALGILKPPGLWGAHGVDIACGEGQPLGVPMNSGGPYFGFFSTRMRFVRQMPGRLVGKTTDAVGNSGYSLSLQTREQHIRRAKATSNICTNQGLLVTAATIHMSLLGADGLAQVALQCYHNTCALIAGLTQIQGVKLVFNAPYFHEALLHFDKPLTQVLKELEAAGINGGLAIEPYYPLLKNTLLVCATEMRTADEISHYIATLAHIME